MNDMQPSEGANTLKALEQFGQSPWLDFIQRSFLADGRLQTLIDRDGLKGMTSNPSIFEKAMGHGTDYDGGFKRLAETGDVDAQTIYESAGDRGHPARRRSAAPGLRGDPQDRRLCEPRSLALSGVAHRGHDR